MSRIRAITGTAVLAVACLRVIAAPGPGIHFVEAEGERGTVRGTIYVPLGADHSEPMPTILFMHGWGQSGTDGLRQMAIGLPQAIFENAERWPYIVVMPQKPVFNADWDHYFDGAIALLDLAINDYGADADRVGVTGLSQGGHATIALATAYPDRFKAAAPVCGYTMRRFKPDGDPIPFEDRSDPETIERAANALAPLPIWIFHGEADEVVSIDEAKLLHEALRKVGASDLTLTIFPETGHNAWDQAYLDSELWQWFGERLAKKD